MEFSISVRDGASNWFAPMVVVDEEGQETALDIEYRRLAPLRCQNPIAIDLLIVGATVYAADKLHSRRSAEAEDCWTREIVCTVPVSDPRRWRLVAAELSSCLSFLTGDSWKLKFSRLESDPVRTTKRQRRRLPARPAGSAVSLFSGGLDSLIGCIDWLESSNESLIVVGHHDGQMGGPFTDQRAILALLADHYGDRVSPVLARVGHDGSAEEITLRGRSFLFLVLGVFVASAIGDAVPLLMPENGTIALNVPLTPSRRGSCSTRTAHPFYLQSLRGVLQSLGFANPILNPLMSRTKGEAVAHCRNRDLLKETAPLSASCAKRGHKSSWAHRGARECGRCMPCIYRRAALHVVGWDREQYGSDICAGEVPIDDADRSSANDFRACISFLRRRPSDAEIARSLLVGGTLDFADLAGHASTVQRSMKEIRKLLRDKATADVRQAAGV